MLNENYHLDIAIIRYNFQLTSLWKPGIIGYMTNGLLFEDSDLTKEASIQCSSPPLAYAMAPNRLVDYVWAARYFR